MKAAATIAVAKCGDRNVVVNQRCAPPFSVRQCGDQILLASSAAAPVGGDELSLTIDVGPAAHAQVGSVAASMVWPGTQGQSSSMSTDCTVANDAHLDLWLEPTISIDGSHHSAATVVRLDAGATCRVVEEVQLGRTGEPSGHLDLSLRVERGGRPLLHHHESFGPTVAGALSSVSVGAARFAVAAVIVGVDVGLPSVRVEDHRAAAWLPIAPDAATAMAVAADRPAAINLLDELNARCLQRSEYRSSTSRG